MYCARSASLPSSVETLAAGAVEPTASPKSCARAAAGAAAASAAPATASSECLTNVFIYQISDDQLAHLDQIVLGDGDHDHREEPFDPHHPCPGARQPRQRPRRQPHHHE